MAHVPLRIDIHRRRGDTGSEVFAIKKPDGTAQDITGFSFLLTVDPRRNPPDATLNLFQLTGTILTPATAGRVRFGPLTTGQANQATGTAFYDVQLVDAAGASFTVAIGEWVTEMDVTK